MVQMSFPSFSNPVVDGGDQNNPDGSKIGRCYGDLSLPSQGDIALVGFRSETVAVILGYLPTNYLQQTRVDAPSDLQAAATGLPVSPEQIGIAAGVKPTYWGTMRRIQPGEFTRKSAQQAEIYQDKAGAVQIIAKAQPVKNNEALDGSATSAAKDINPQAVPKSELVRLVVGETYDDDTFAQRMVSLSGKKVVFGVLGRLTDEGYQSFHILDSDGNFELHGNSVNLYQSQVDGSMSIMSINSVGQISLWDSSGNQIILDAPNKKIVISTENGDNIVMGSGNIQIAAQGGDSIVLDSDADSVTINAQSVNVRAGQISLGPEALSPTGLDAVVTLARLLTIYNAHTHLVSTTGAPTGTPIIPMTPTPGVVTCPGSPITQSV